MEPLINPTVVNNCEDFECRLHEVLDSRLAPEADVALRAHARGCPACQDLLASVGALLVGVRGLQIPAAASDLAERVRAELQRDQVAAKAHTLRTWGYALSTLAAAILVAAWAATRPTQDVVPVAPPVQVAEARPSMDELVRSTGQRYEDLLRETSDSLNQIAMLLPGVSDPQAERAAAERAPIEGASAPQSESVAQRAAAAAVGATWVKEFGEGLRPVTETTTGAFGFLIELLPEIEVPPRS